MQSQKISLALFSRQALQGLRFSVEMRRPFWKIQKECRAEPALPVVVPPIPHTFVFIPDLLQLDLIARERS